MTTAPTRAPRRARVGAFAHVVPHPLAGSLTVVAVLAALSAAVLLTAGDLWSSALAPQVLVDMTIGISSPPMGAVILAASGTPRGARALGWVLVGSGVCAGLAAVTTAYVLVVDEVTWPAEALVQLQSVLWVPGFIPALTLVPLLYPDGLLPGRRWRVLAGMAVLGMVMLAVGSLLYPDSVTGHVPVGKPFTAQGAAEVLVLGSALLLVPAALGALTGLVVRLRTSRGLRRRQVVVLLLAAGVLVVVTLLQGVIPSPADLLAQALAVALVPVAIGVAVTRHRLYELDTALCRALVAASLTACLGGLYFTVVAVTERLAPAGVGTALAAGLTGAAIQPLARRLSDGVERLYYGDRTDPYAVASGLAARLTEAGDLTELPRVVCETVVDGLRLGSASVSVMVGGAERRLATYGAESGVVQRFALRHRGEHIGWLACTARPGEPAIDPRDAEILGVVADQAAPAVAALRLSEQLQQSRESLVEAREEERLRLRRELHDGLGATLAGLRLQVESAQALVDDDTAVRLLEAAGAGVSQAVAEVRSITDDLRPPALDDLGLARSLGLLAERMDAPGFRVDCDIADLPPLSAALEVAAYRITAEALANAARHARAGRVRLVVRVREHSLDVVVSDDGVGWLRDSASSGSGLGLASMRLRAEEIGGSLDLVMPEHGRGTSVRASLPITTVRT